jgi:hypothetical protein
MTVRASENAKRAELQQLTQQAAEQIDRLLQPVGVAAQGLTGRFRRGEVVAAAVETELKTMVNGNQVFFFGTVACRHHAHDARTRLYAPHIERNGAQAGPRRPSTVAKLVIRTRAFGVNRDPRQNEANHE